MSDDACETNCTVLTKMGTSNSDGPQVVHEVDSWVPNARAQLEDLLPLRSPRGDSSAEKVLYTLFGLLTFIGY